MSVDISVITISQKESNVKALLNSIATSNLSGISLEVLCSWNAQNDWRGNLKRYDFPVKVVNQKPYHFSKNNNDLVAQATGSYVLFVNDDVELDAHCLYEAYMSVKKSTVGIVGANLRYPTGLLQHGGIFFDDNDLPYHRYKNQLAYTDPRVGYNLVVPAVTGAFMMLRTDEFKAIQFDETCEVAGQDVILCLEYSKAFAKDIVYVGNATALHRENDTRRDYDQRLTPDSDLKRITASRRDVNLNSNSSLNDHIRLRIVTEGEGWIMHRMAVEIAKHLPNVVINEDYPDANIHYFINYGYFKERPTNGMVVSNFTHFDPSHLADRWQWAAENSDHCVSISSSTTKELYASGVSEGRVTTIPIGADASFAPKMTLGLVGRTYKGGRKGEALIAELIQDAQLMNGLQIVSNNDAWGVPVWSFDELADFYRAVDFLLVPALREGGPVPFMEALACGTMAIAPAIGVVPDFPHVPYEVGSIESLKETIKQLKLEFLERKNRLAVHMKPWNWEMWAIKHIALFRRLLEKNADNIREDTLAVAN
jgi:hypothetical protein